jgi:hypothetical protein
MFICHPYGKILTIKYNYHNTCILDAVKIFLSGEGALLPAQFGRIYRKSLKQDIRKSRKTHNDKSIH